jgi:hypothetical protein
MPGAPPDSRSCGDDRWGRGRTVLSVTAPPGSTAENSRAGRSMPDLRLKRGTAGLCRAPGADRVANLTLAADPAPAIAPWPSRHAPNRIDGDRVRRSCRG